ncbi:MAG TPA: arginine--tRNA ligase [Planctomycetota bacterium]|nr:arginine--tRNA ligase [Planctomycetota bacterium]
MDILKDDIAAKVAKALGLAAADVLPTLEAPKDTKRGDLALPCFKLVKPLGREGKDAPMKIAKEIVEKTEKGTLLAAIEAAGPFVNFKLAPGALAASVLQEIAKPQRYGGSSEGKGKKIVIDYSSPNIAKPFHLGHLRSTVIGHSIRRLYESLGYEVVGINHLGDWGTQFGFMMAAWQRWKGEAEERIAKGEGEIDVFVTLYVRINQLAKQDDKVRDEARSWFKRLEQGDAEARTLWQFFVERSKKEFDRIYAILQIRHESDAGESFYEDKMKPVIDLLRAKGLLVQGKPQKPQGDDDEDADEGRPEGVDLGDPKEGGLGFAIVLKSDGGTTYVTRDLAAALYREQTYRPEKMVYVVGAPQSLHFKQLKTILERAGQAWQEKMIHVPFGQYLGMSTRAGNVVYLDEVLARAKQMAIEASRNAQRGPDMTDEDLFANAPRIGTGAVKFFDLKNGRLKDIELPKNADQSINLDRVLATDGETGPYVQMAHARCAGILRRLGFQPTTAVDYALLDEPETREVVRTLAEHPAKIRLALKDHEPSVIARHLYELAQSFATFYNRHRILDAPEETKKARALLVLCAKKVMAQCLDLLGIDALEKM